VITPSLNEIDAVVKRAARGVGLDWGHAEEAGKAARVLAAQRICGLDLVLRAMLRRDTEGAGEGSCPFLLGPALADGTSPAGPLGPVRDPALLLGYLAPRAKADGTAMRLSWPGFDAVVTPGGIRLVDATGVAAEYAPEVRLGRIDKPGIGEASGDPAALVVDPETWSALLALGHRTFVPPSARSRAGAGSALPEDEDPARA
jgi:hypothetical protein